MYVCVCIYIYIYIYTHTYKDASDKAEAMMAAKRVHCMLCYWIIVYYIELYDIIV